MRALRLRAFGQDPQIEMIPRPVPATGEVRIRIKACGLNFADLLMINGTYQDTPPLPFTLGMEISGIVEAHGEGVSSPPIGSSVAVFGGSGGLADYTCVNAARVTPLPEGTDMNAAAALQVAYGTSHVALDYKAKLKKGEVLLVLGAAGGVGLTAVEIGKLMGATVIACARGADKLAIAKAAGADHLIDASCEDIHAAVKALGGADVVYDPVGGKQFTAAMRACNPEARLLSIGFASGDVPQIKANHLLVKNLTVIGFYWGGYMGFKPEVVTDSLTTLAGWLHEGRITPHISHALPLDQALEGMALLKTRKSTGKVVITLVD
ncbi:NADPH:quinone oxidoreductase family protein [Lentibacter algarum]|uniref:NADPH:quinone oxidoreductase family protein n=1 Tax=Lentibacter algarum TaxID=576131 RepID=UPI001C064FFE|nr:NADPH:quinone oxidoreductase family protein [Lentibacter algarum]MBU2980766.1 NADPH:quinone oxidoreductase family protein [Lentibacter algarum]